MGRPDAEDAAGRAAEMIADQVRTIVEAAESTAAEIRREAEEESARVRREAEEESARVRRQAAETAALVSERIDKVERELTELLRESFAALRREAAGMGTDQPPPARAPVEPADQAPPARAPVEPADQAPPPRGPVEPADRGEVAQEPAAEEKAEEATGPGDTSVEGEALDEEQPERRGFFRRRPRDTDEPRTAGGDEPALSQQPRTEAGDAPEPRGSDEFGPSPQDAEGARLIALNMALNGTPREETARYLHSHFELDNPDGILDDVYGRVAG
jgi:hypothetical protein